SVFIDANENPYNTLCNRYPDPLQTSVKEKIAVVKRVKAENIFLGVGSDEPIDLLYRVFCEPGRDNAVAIDPTYGMYGVCADINNVEYRRVRLDDKFDFSADNLLAVTDDNTKLIWLCSPNNPSGNSLSCTEIEKVINKFGGIVVLDEAYIDFSSIPTLLTQLNNYPNLVILQTFSKAWGSAGIRLGMAFASKDIIAIFNKVKYPYNVNILAQRYAIKLLDKASDVKAKVDEIIKNRVYLEKKLGKLPCIKKIYPSDSNFILVSTSDAKSIYSYLVANGIIVRNRHGITLCDQCLRITVGTRADIKKLITALTSYKR
ncbi:MAG: histidinol-phosphate transaminase, partial [Bacteroidales bacterium]